jgi:hypothetical protein
LAAARNWWRSASGSAPVEKRRRPRARPEHRLYLSGLQALDVADRYLMELRAKAPAFCKGAPARAATHLGDSGPSAAERWEPIYGPITPMS